ncbi:unnamed protein product [Clonostachys rosea]|uniref:Uncharacterized protein n=1 Tax=Bionectria ochroleuca TaxID=29856 RepID=A0ABY6TR27_BIOOC|nr:unnamed protein product [Clonostachys rosea]
MALNNKWVPVDYDNSGNCRIADLLHARIRSYSIQYLPVELSSEGPVGDEKLDRLSVTMDLDKIVSRHELYNGVTKVRIDVLIDTCLHCFGTEDRDRYDRFVEDPTWTPYMSSVPPNEEGWKVLKSIFEAFEEFNILNYIVTPIKGDDPTPYSVLLGLSIFLDLSYGWRLHRFLRFLRVF